MPGTGRVEPGSHRSPDIFLPSIHCTPPCSRALSRVARSRAAFRRILRQATPPNGRCREKEMTIT